MKIPKAIAILELSDTWPQEFNKDDLRDALKLGIEALKEIKHLHEAQILEEDELLPGETKD